MIELHDSKVIIRKKGTEDHWGDYAELGEKTVIEGIEFRKLLEQYGIEVSKHVACCNEEVCFRKYKSVFGDGNSPDNHFAIFELEVKIESPFVLSIRTTFETKCPNLLGPPTEIQEVTYCGNFTIWWPVK